MIIVSIVGGLGNQMYGYALYRTLLERGRDAYMDLEFYNHQNSPIITFRKYQLSNVFNITERLKSGRLFSFFGRAARKLNLPNRLFYYYKEEEGPDVFNIKNGYLSGYWQNSKYFAEIEPILRKEFTFKKPLTGKSAEIIERIKNCNSVSVSIRRDDYFRLGHTLPESYYANAIRYIQERVTDAKFFFVSDDIDYCKNTYWGGGMILRLLIGLSEMISISICK